MNEFGFCCDGIEFKNNSTMEDVRLCTISVEDAESIMSCRVLSSHATAKQCYVAYQKRMRHVMRNIRTRIVEERT